MDVIELFLPVITIMGTVLIMVPIVALVPTAFFLVLYFKRPRNLILLPAILWGVYTIYEHLMKFRVLCSGECNIRIDLLVIYPSLLVISLLAIIIFMVTKKKQTN